MLKVCILTETYHPVVGGGETQARLLADGLVARGASVCVVTRRSDARLPRVETQGRVRVYRLPPVGSGQFKKWGLLFSCLPRLFRLRGDYDLIFVSGFRIIGIAAVCVARFFGKKVVLKADSQGEMSGTFFAAGLSRAGIPTSSILFRLFLAGRNRLLRMADAFVAITPDVASEFVEADIPVERIHGVPNGVDTARFRPLELPARLELRRSLRLAEYAKVVVYTGRLVSYKGLPLLLLVWPRILRRHPSAKLVLVGEGGLDIHNCEEDLKSQVRNNRLEQSVTLTGSVDDVAPWLQAADLFAFPTENDAFPSSLVEALASGLAVVTTPVGAIKSVIRDGENGLMVRSGDPDGLYEALDRLLTSPSLRAELGEAARRTVLARCSSDVVIRQYAELFLGLVQ